MKKLQAVSVGILISTLVILCTATFLIPLSVRTVRINRLVMLGALSVTALCNIRIRKENK